MNRKVFAQARRRLLLALPATFLLALAPLSAAQAKWPERPVRIVLPFGAGGVADVSSRLLADKLSEKFGQRFLVENMPGAGGISAARTVVTSDPDGYTFGLVTNGTAISVAAFKSLPFDPTKQFEMVSTIGLFDLVFAVNSQSEYKTFGDFLKAAKAAPGKLNVGTVAAGSTQNLGAELLKSLAGLDVTIVPFKNSPDIVIGLLRNDVQMLVEFPPAIQGQVNEKTLRVVASSSPKRNPLNPDVPTAAEAGVPGYEVESWNGIFAPKGTPKEIIDAMNAAIREILATKEMKDAYAKVGVIANASSPDELMKRLTADIKKWDDVIVKAGIPKK